MWGLDCCSCSIDRYSWVSGLYDLIALPNTNLLIPKLMEKITDDLLKNSVVKGKNQQSSTLEVVEATEWYSQNEHFVTCFANFSDSTSLCDSFTISGASLVILCCTQESIDCSNS